MPLTRDDISEVAKIVAEALRDPGFKIDEVRIVTVGETSNPELDRKLFCDQCLTKGPIYHMAHVKRDAYGIALRNPDKSYQREDAGIVYDENERSFPVPKLISYDEVSALESLKKGIAGKQCKHCGAPK